VYRWTNLIARKSYIGSSINIGARLRSYFNITFLEKELKKGNSIINASLLKNGYSNFSFEILEYCTPENTIEREQYYLTSLKPEYNILKVAGSPLGFKHSKETIAKFKNKTLTAEHLAKFKAWAISPKNIERLKKLNSNLELRSRRLEKLKIYVRSTEFQEKLKAMSLSVQVFDTLTNEKTAYSSISEAARSIGCTPSTISKALKKQELAYPPDQEKIVKNLIKKRYVVFPIGDGDSSIPIPLDTMLWESNAQKVEILDTLNGNSTVYASIREAALGIECVHATIVKAIRHFKETGENRLIKKRFKVKSI